MDTRIDQIDDRQNHKSNYEINSEYNPHIQNPMLDDDSDPWDIKD